MRNELGNGGRIYSNKTAEIAGRGQRKNAITGRRKDRIYG